MDALFGQVDAVEGGEETEGKDIQAMELQTAVARDVEKDSDVTHVELSAK